MSGVWRHEIYARVGGSVKAKSQKLIAAAKPPVRCVNFMVKLLRAHGGCLGG